MEMVKRGGYYLSKKEENRRREFPLPIGERDKRVRGEN
jgi:hypothetical protein